MNMKYQPSIFDSQIKKLDFAPYEMEQTLSSLKNKYKKVKLSISSHSQSSSIPTPATTELPLLFLVLYYSLHFVNQLFLIFLIIHHLLITEMNLMNILLFHK